MALALCGHAERGSAAGPINGPSQWLWGEAEAHTERTTWRHTATGLAIHHAMSIFWAAAHELACTSSRVKNPTRICVVSAGIGALAYVVDYHVAPRRLRPGFRKHLGPRSLFVVYAAFAAGLALTSLTRGKNRE